MTSARASDARGDPPGRFWPTATQEWLLRVALGSPSETLSAWAGRAPHLAAGPLDRGSLRLLPLVRWSLARVLDEAQLADPLLAEAARIHAEAERRNDGLLHDAEALTRELAGAGIDALLLKGAALILTSYPAPGLRPMVDLDVLVPHEAIADAAALLVRQGWVPEHRLTPDFVRTRHAAPFRSPQGRRCDLHWDLFEEHCPPHADAACWAGARVVDLRGTPVRLLHPTDQFLHVVIHGTRWARTPGVRWVADAVLVLREGIDWGRLAAQGEARGFVLRLRLALEYLRARWSAPVPEAILDALRAHRPSNRERLEHWARDREHRLLGFLPFWVCNYLRSVTPPGRPSPAGLIGYLEAVWGVPSVLGVVSGAVVRATRRVRPGPRPTPRAGTPARQRRR
jgi:hypothetical protein